MYVQYMKQIKFSMFVFQQIMQSNQKSAVSETADFLCCASRAKRFLLATEDGEEAERTVILDGRGVLQAL